MAANKFDIPVWDPQFVQWAQNVNAANANKSKASQDQWDKIYGMVRDYGEKRRAEAEAEKARQEQFDEAAKQRQFQAFENAMNRSLQRELNNKNLAEQKATRESQLNMEQMKNMAKAQDDLAVLQVEKDKELAGIDVNDTQKRALVEALYKAKENQIFSRYGVKRPDNQDVIEAENKLKQFQVAPTPEVAPEPKPAEVNFEQIKQDMQNEREKIKGLKSGERGKAMEAFNEKYQDYAGKNGEGLYTAEEIKKGKYVPPKPLPKGTPLSASRSEALAQAKKTGQSVKFDPESNMWVIK